MHGRSTGQAGSDDQAIRLSLTDLQKVDLYPKVPAIN